MWKTEKVPALERKTIMASLAQRLRDWLKSPFRGKQSKGKEPEMARGHRGTALRDLQKPDLSEENRTQWRHLTETEHDAFLEKAKPIYVHSSNVLAVQWWKESNQMAVVYKGDNGKAGGTYLYQNVSRREAELFLAAPSKGSWIWDHLRFRGSKTAHRKPYAKIS